MGIEKNINFTSFPKQGAHVGARVRVVFQYDTTLYMTGTILRDDAEAPFRTIIKLDDGRLVLSTECQYSLVRTVEKIAMSEESRA